MGVTVAAAEGFEPGSIPPSKLCIYSSHSPINIHVSVRVCVCVCVSVCVCVCVCV